ncbi:MAG TPA: hypothetical protein VGQ33_05910 [Vicinamibacteria bacterium]|jgi:hypothetical protein|nr:hypothetical protein [Vicinamibacteria bacterium]
MKQWTAFTVALALAGTTGAGLATSGEDDLAIVKKAVASPAPARARVVRTTATAQAAPVVAPAPAVEATPRARTGREPQWFKVRVVDRGTGRKKVTINLPLSLVRALGDDTIDWGCRSGDGDRDKCHTVRLSEVLRSLEAGQELVEIEDDEATVKVWVE